MQNPTVTWRRLLRIRARTVAVAFVLVLSVWYLASGVLSRPTPLSAEDVAHQFPLVWEHIVTSNKTGGAWYIPPAWLGSQDQPKTIVEAATLASRAALAKPERQLPFSRIPLIVHQTYKTTEAQTWNPLMLPFVEKWLSFAARPQENQPMAYFFWTDEGINELIHGLESDFARSFELFPRIERTDIFRMLACKWFGGIYGDMDTEPLKPPQQWISLSDVSSWVDPVTNEKYGLAIKQKDGKAPVSARPVNFIGGIEADLDPDTDTYWRMGYKYPIQLTQWALASAPNHPVVELYQARLRALADEAEAAAQKAGVKLDALEKAYAVERTGPHAFTEAVRSYLEEKLSFRWNSLTGREDDGKVKLVVDVLILPITGFSPGRQKSMGSKPVDDVQARLVHHFFGSWRHWNLATESGKLCRTLFGMCRDWSMVDA
ncbi:hypothetical protein NLU13_3472 [Sarocladium strictum]|uniref:Uncharacterized protein n=1 Tax=Sarocladium strictum TaxID=5046 RepID=A0AA39LAG9_SARSR|nr:hypothetical protein NLU13_3472 [Sarocladium strictum]